MQATRSFYGRLLDGLMQGAAALAALCILSVCILMVSMSLSREFGINLRGADDLIAWLCAASAFLILGQTFQHGGIVRVEIFLGALGPEWRKRLEIIGLVVMSGFWIPQIFTAIGCLIFFLAVVDELMRVIKGGKPRYQQMAEDRLSAGDFGETL